MKFYRISFLATLILSGALPVWADSAMPIGPCHDVDMYGIYKVCGSPVERHPEDRRETQIQPVYVTIPQPYATPAPTPSSDFSSVPTPPATDDDSSRRDLKVVDDRLHALHLYLDDKQSRGEIGANFFDEETRYLTQLEQREQSTADANGGYLTVAQENSFLQQLQAVETEINQTIANNG
jgi:hypothetical protein